MNTVSTATLDTRNATGRKIISIVQIVLLVTISIFPYMDKMFTWSTYAFLGGDRRDTSLSLSNLMTMQEIGVGPIVFWAFMILLAVMVSYCVLQIFKEFSLTRKPITSALPGTMLILGGLMVFSANSYSSIYEYEGNVRRISVSMEIMAYIFLVLLAAVLLLELYKQLKMNN